MKDSIKAFVIVAMLLMTAYIAIPMDDSSAADENKTCYEIGDTCTFWSGSGTTTHEEKSDKSAYVKDAKASITMVVDSLPTTYDNGWNDYGNLRITGFTFSSSSDLVYIPSYIVYKSNFDGASHIYLYKVVAIDDAAKKQLNDNSMEIVLPKALRSESFGSNVTVTTEGVYVDSYGNTIHYSVDETMPFYMNGFGTYTMYSYSDTPDKRYCEQGTVTKVDYAPGQTTYETSTVQWCKHPMTSCDRWVCGSFADMIGVVLTDNSMPAPDERPVVDKVVVAGMVAAVLAMFAFGFFRRGF